MSQYPIVKYRPKHQSNLFRPNFDRKTTGKFLFVGSILILLFCCIYLPFKGIRYNSNTNSLASRGLEDISIIETKKAQTSIAPVEPVIAKPEQKEAKASPLPPVNLSFLPKIRFPDLITPIGNSINQITEGFSQVEKAPAKTAKALDLTNPSNSGIAPNNLSIDPFASNNSKIEALSGKVIWQDGINYSVKSDKFILKSSLAIQASGKDIVLTVDNSGLLPANALLSVNRDTFIKLGGNPDTQTSIDAIVKTR